MGTMEASTPGSSVELRCTRAYDSSLLAGRQFGSAAHLVRPERLAAASAATEYGSGSTTKLVTPVNRPAQTSATADRHAPPSPSLPNGLPGTSSLHTVVSVRSKEWLRTVLDLDRGRLYPEEGD